MNARSAETDRPAIASDFPILDRQVHGKPLVYLDNAATTQKPRMVIDAIRSYYEHSNANVHRAAHRLAEEATLAMEEARARIAGFIGAAEAAEIIFTRGTTESINLVAQTLGSGFGPGDEILISQLEHHSNIVPWQMVAERTGATLRVCNVTPAGDLDLAHFHELLGARTRLVAISHVSNALGTINPVRALCAAARAAGAAILIDGAQATQHLPIDVVELGCDYYAFSGHKMFGPTGIGVLYGRRQCLEALPPWQGGGEMIEQVSFDGTTYNELPYKFEAGTPNIAGIIGLGAAVDYLRNLPRAALLQAEQDCVSRVLAELRQMPEIRLVGEPEHRLSVISFNVDGAHSADIGTLLDQQGIAVRTGHHCAMPLMSHLGVNGTVRASFALYNGVTDAERFLTALRKTLTFL